MVVVGLEELEPEPAPPGPFMLERPLFCSVFGRRGSMTACQTVVYRDGPPPPAKLPGSRLPSSAPSEQHGAFVPQKGPAAHAAQPMYTGLLAM